MNNNTICDRELNESKLMEVVGGADQEVFQVGDWA